MAKLPSQDAELQRRIERREQTRRSFEQARSVLNDASNYRNNIQAAYGGRYEYLKGAIPGYKENMRYAFQQASYSWDSGNKSAASDWSAQGKRLKAELQDMYSEKEEALEQLKAAGEQFRQALDVFRARKAEFEAARDAVSQRYDELKAENERKRKEREARERKWEQERQQDQQERNRQHQHAVMAREEEQQERQRRWQNVLAKRQSFVELASARAKQKIGQELRDNVEKGWKVQSRNEDFTVKVKSGWDIDTGQIVTDILIFPHGVNEHLHMGIDEHHNVIFEEWNPNHR